MLALSVIAYNALEECGQVFLCANARAPFLSLSGVVSFRVLRSLVSVFAAVDACNALLKLFCALE